MANLRKRKTPSEDGDKEPTPEPPKKAPRKKKAAPPKKTAAAKKPAAKKATAKAAAEPKKTTRKAARSTAKGKAVAQPEPESQETSGVSQDSTKNAKDGPPDPKKARTATSRGQRTLPVINTMPTEKMLVFTFGTGDSSELGQGQTAKCILRPRLMQKLLPDGPGVVQIAAGSMHGAVLTWKGEVMTWGVNDLFSLGRKTAEKDPTRSMNSNKDDSDNDDDAPLNELECQPIKVDGLEEYRIVKVACCDNSTWCLTDTGLVVGWGTFRDAEGNCLFRKGTRIQETPFLIPELKNITTLACASNNVFALDIAGTVWGWGSGNAMGLGRRIGERHTDTARIPSPMPLPKRAFASIASGSFTGYAIRRNGQVYTWGPNGWGQAGFWDLSSEEAAAKSAESLSKPMVINDLSDKDIVQVFGGENHALFLDRDGKLFGLGRADYGQLAADAAALDASNSLYEFRKGENRLRLVARPVPCASSLDVKTLACGIDHNIAVSVDGKPFSWGYASMNALGLGQYKEVESVEVPTAIVNTAVKDVVMRESACGAHFSILAGVQPSSAAAGMGNAVAGPSKGPAKGQGPSNEKEKQANKDQGPYKY